MALHICIGPMFSGKTSHVIREVERYNLASIPVLSVNHTSDSARTDGHTVLRSHNARVIPATMVSKLGAVLSMPEYAACKVVAIDEAQFFDDLQSIVLHMVEKDSKIVYVSGLDGTSDRKRFGQILDLVPYADTCIKLNGICKDCQHTLVDAPFTRALGTKSADIEIGGADKYEAVCRTHWRTNARP